MDLDPCAIRHSAIEAALNLGRTGGGIHDTKSLIEAAKEIESYIVGQATPSPTAPSVTWLPGADGSGRIITVT